MGSSGEDPNKGIDASVGGLVWVRRRNGSWWPGKILSPDELPEGCVPTPRAGTPVKLLGREDASVDWYNLEKSKRIKAFHCGEYEDCIEKAKSAGSHLSKKGVKYARREDAILHALELESARLGKDHLDLSATPDTQNGEHHVDEPSAFHPSEESGDVDKDLNGSGEDSDLAQEPSQSGVSFEEPNRVDSAKKEPKQRRTPNDSEDDGAGGVKRMKGLEDLGMGIASSLKRKRSQVAHVHEFLKRKSRRRTLTKVLESTTVLPEPVDEKVSGPTEPSVPTALDNKASELESNESKSSHSVLINTNSDNNGVPCENATPLNASGHANDTSSLGSKQKDSKNSSILRSSSKESVRLPVIPEEGQSAGTSTILSDASPKVLVGSGAQSNQSIHIETFPLRKEEHNESVSTGSGAANVQQISDKIEKGTSEWQLKGKRNSRSRKADIENEAETYATVVDEGSNHISRSISDDTGSHFKSKPITEIQVEEFSSWNRNSPQKENHTRGGSMSEMPAPQRTLPYRQSRFTVNPKYDSSDFSLSHHITGSGMYDVTIKVKMGNRPQHVPYISLMSKFSGQPITGHPLTVEVLEEGFCDDLLKTSQHRTASADLSFNPGKNVLVPALQGTGMAYNKLKAHGRPARKHGSRRSRSGPLAKPPSSRRNGIMSKKIRKLSSLTGSLRLSREQKKSVMEKLKGPSIACVPLKVVFSRINAALV